MALLDLVSKDMVTAMKAHESTRLDALRCNAGGIPNLKYSSRLVILVMPLGKA